MMTMQRLLKRIHAFGTAWFLFCAASLLIISLRQAGVNWWLVFSISGYSLVVFAFLLAFYLFALFRGVVRAQYVQEHPLSTTPAYLFLYDSAPLWGAAAGLISSYGISDLTVAARMVTEGTLIMTFVTWVILDSAVGAVESALPQSRRHRAKRLAEARAEKERMQRENAALLETLERSQNAQRRAWEAAFGQVAAELADLYCSGKSDFREIQTRTVEAGAKAWQTGRMACMRFVHQMICEEMKRRTPKPHVDYAALEWDGIGTWRRPKEPMAAFAGL